MNLLFQSLKGKKGVQEDDRYLRAGENDCFNLFVLSWQ